MIQYLLSVWHDETYELDFSGPEAQRIVAQVERFNAELEDSGAWVFGGGLHPAATASVARFSDGSVSMTDGPYAEAKEQIGGFWVIDVAGTDEANDWGRRGAAACEGAVEVRRFHEE